MQSNRKAWIFVALMAAFFATLSCGILIGRAIESKKQSASAGQGEETVKQTVLLTPLTAETPKTETQEIPANGGQEFYSETSPSLLGSEEDKAYLKKFFTEYSQDPVQAKLIDRNYYTLYDLSVADEDFEARLVGACGEAEQLRVLVDIVVKDKKLAADFESICVEYQNLSPEEFKTNLSQYGTEIIYGTKDPDREDLFHCVLIGRSAWLIQEEEALFALMKIELLPSASSGREAMVFHPNLQFTMVLPGSAYYHGASVEYYDNTTFDYNGITYYLRSGDYFLTRSHLCMDYTFADSQIAKDNERFEDVERELLKSFREAIKEMYILVDGTRIDLKRTNVESFWFDTEKGKGKDSEGVIWLQFDAVDFKNVNQLELHVGNQAINLKYFNIVSY